MRQDDDQNLLRAWSRDRCEESFRTLVDRYADLVFGTAARRVKDRLLAEEVSQNVFAALAKKSGRLCGAGGIGGWLFKATVLEAAKCRRAAARRAMRMRELEQIDAALRDAGGASLTGAAMAELDEALAALGRSDRDLVVARFYHGMSFEELSKSLGKSEAACRKRVSRALQNLRGALEGRGVKVSSTVLGGGLGAIMSVKAPAGMASSCATAAMAATAAPAATGFLTTVVATMSTSKIGGALLIGGALFFMSAGAGYLVGRESVQGERSIVSSASAGGVSQGRPAKSPGDGPREGGGDARSAGGNLSRVEAIVMALKKEARNGDDPDVFEAAAKIAGQLRASEMAEALALIRGEADPLRRRLIQILYERWGSVAGREAVNQALEEDGETTIGYALGAAVTTWARNDPERAWKWQEQFRMRGDLPVDESRANRLAGVVLREWARRDVDAAWGAFEALGPDLQRAAMRQIGELILDPERVEEMATRMAAISDERVRFRVAEEVGEMWARVEPRAAATWFETLEYEDAMVRMRAAMEIGEGWFESDPSAAADWLWPMLPEGMHEQFATMLLRSPWFDEDAAGLSSWLVSKGFDPEKLGNR